MLIERVFELVRAAHTTGASLLWGCQVGGGAGVVSNAFIGGDVSADKYVIVGTGIPRNTEPASKVVLGSALRSALEGEVHERGLVHLHLMIVAGLTTLTATAKVLEVRMWGQRGQGAMLRLRRNRASTANPRRG